MTDRIDPKGLIKEAYRIEGIGPGECRSILLDWALSLPDGVDQRAALQDMVTRHAVLSPDHPMSAVLKEGLDTVPAPRRRGGWRTRTRPAAKD